MAATSNVIVLPSSSPERIFARSPTPVAYSPGQLFGLSPRGSSPPPMLSPSTLFRSSHSARALTGRSRDGFADNDKTPLTAGVSRENLPVLNARQKDSQVKPKRAAKKLVRGQATTATDSEQSSLGPTSKTVKKPSNAKKVPSRSTSKHQEPGNKTLKGRVTKPESGKAKDSGKEMVALLPLEPPEVHSASKTLNDSDREGVQLEEATKRRLDWTPTKDSKKQIIDLDDEVNHTASQASNRRGFGNLLSNYEFNGETRPAQDGVRGIGDEGPTKRRRIELVDSNIFSISRPRQLEINDGSSGDSIAEGTRGLPGEKKQKPRKKRMTTITAHATARYIPEERGESATLHRYLVIDEEEPTAEKASNTTKRKVSKAKRKKNDKSNKETAAPQHTVLPPEAAFRSLENQELLFGTCSQLERDDSPTLVRETQIALRASESMIPVGQASHLSQSSTSNSSATSTVSRFTSSRNLWSVAARDLDGSLVQMDVLDLVDSPNVSKISSEICQPVSDRAEGSRTGQQDSWVEIEDSPTAQEKGVISITEQNSDLKAKESAAAVARSGDRLDCQSTKLAAESAVPPPAMPRYTGFTDAELAKQIAAYGFKPVKGRDRMIELLQKCWETKHPEAAKQTNSTARARSQSSVNSKTVAELDLTEQRSQTGKPFRPSKAKSTASQSKRAGRRRDLGSSTPISKHSSKKTTTSQKHPQPSSFQNVEEIDDSEDELIPSPNRLRSSYAARDATPLSLPLSATPSPVRAKHRAQDSIVTSSHPVDLPELSAQVAEAIRSQRRIPSVNGRKRPTWHEKILMYDPIVLEDLAVWLNTEGFSLVGEDREVSAGFVREWCESRGICCCWKKNGW